MIELLWLFGVLVFFIIGMYVDHLIERGRYKGLEFSLITCISMFFLCLGGFLLECLI